MAPYAVSKRRRRCSSAVTLSAVFCMPRHLHPIGHFREFTGGSYVIRLMRSLADAPPIVGWTCARTTEAGSAQWKVCSCLIQADPVFYSWNPTGPSKRPSGSWTSSTAITSCTGQPKPGYPTARPSRSPRPAPATLAAPLLRRGRPSDRRGQCHHRSHRPAFPACRLSIGPAARLARCPLSSTGLPQGESRSTPPGARGGTRREAASTR